MVCSAGHFDLNSSSFDGCEFTLDNTTVYVSTTDSAAADDATCGLGKKLVGLLRMLERAIECFRDLVG